jgi:hypothetical protein
MMHNEQVHGGNVRHVVTQEGPPSLAGRPPQFDHVLGDARLRDLNPELEQFAVMKVGLRRFFRNHTRDDSLPPSVPTKFPVRKLPTQVSAGQRGLRP